MQATQKRRFDRINPNQNVNIKKNDIFVEDCTDRLILDFDNNIPVNTRTSVHSASQTPIKTYDEELAQIVLIDTKDASICDLAQASLAYDRSSPKLVPCEEKQEFFGFKARTLAIAIFLCALASFAVMGLSPVQALSGQSLIEDAAAQAKDLSPQKLEAALQLVQSTEHAGGSHDAVEGFRLFLQSWRERMDAEAPHETISVEMESFPRSVPSAHAAYVNQLLDEHRVEEARHYAQSLDPHIFRAQIDYQRWINASLAKAEGQWELAARGFEKISGKRLSAFAVVELGQMALEDEKSLALQVFLERALSPNDEDLPAFANCALELLSTGSDSDISAWRSMAQPYRDYCALAQIKQNLRLRGQSRGLDLAQIQSLAPNNVHKLRVGVALALSNSNLHLAATLLHELKDVSRSGAYRDLEENFVDTALATGQVQALAQIYPELSGTTDYVMVLRYLDMRRTFPADLAQFKQADWPGFLAHSDSEMPQTEPTHPYLLALHQAYKSAYNGFMQEALGRLSQIVAAYPQNLEPFVMQVQFLSASGQNQKAAQLLAIRAKHSKLQAPLLSTLTLMNARANSFNPILYPTQYFAFSDISLRKNQCEAIFLHRAGDARSCAKRLQSLAPNDRTLIAMNAILDPAQNPKAQFATLQRANAGAFSFQGLHSQRALAAISAEMHQEAATALSDAIVFAPTDMQAPMNMANYYAKRFKSFEGSKKLEKIIDSLPKYSTSLELLAQCHLAAAKLCKPGSANPAALKHLLKAKDIVGNEPGILQDLISYYRAKQKPYFVQMYTRMLQEEDRETQPTTL